MAQEEKGFKLETAKFDARFPNTNQTRNCWQNYVDFHRCVNIKGEEYEPCGYFKKVYKSLCPVAWVSCRASTLIKAYHTRLIGELELDPIGGHITVGS